MNERELIDKFSQSFDIAKGKAKYKIYKEYAIENFDIILKQFKILYKKDFPKDKIPMYRAIYKDWFFAETNKAKRCSHIREYLIIRLKELEILNE